MCTGAEALIFSALFGGATAAATSARSSMLASKSRKGAREQVQRDKDILTGKRKEALITREQSLAKNVATSAAARGGTSAVAGGAAPGQTLGNSQLFRRTLG